MAVTTCRHLNSNPTDRLLTITEKCKCDDVSATRTIGSRLQANYKLICVTWLMQLLSDTIQAASLNFHSFFNKTYNNLLSLYHSLIEYCFICISVELAWRLLPIVLGGRNVAFTFFCVGKNQILPITVPKTKWLCLSLIHI